MSKAAQQVAAKNPEEPDQHATVAEKAADFDQAAVGSDDVFVAKAVLDVPRCLYQNVS